MVFTGATDEIKESLARIDVTLDPSEPRSLAERYYQSEEFTARLRQIAAGEELPRVLVSTCRWTTFLKHCAGDFQRAFEKLGCPTRYIMQENDVQILTAKSTGKLNEFRPDLLFSVSHARPSFILPTELPVISYVQDRCGPLLILDIFPSHFQQDLFVCMMRNFQTYLISKNIPANQVFVMPIPADETIFYPLPRTIRRRGGSRWMWDSRNTQTHGDKAFDEFVQRQLAPVGDPAIRTMLISVCTELYRAIDGKDNRRHYDDEMLTFVNSRLPEEFRERQ